MLVEFQVKYAKTKEGVFNLKETKEQREERLEEERTRRIIGIDDDMEVESESQNMFAKIFDPKNLEIFYQPHVLDVNDITEFYQYDEDHVVIVQDGGGLLPVKAKWNYFVERIQFLKMITLVKF